MRRKPLDHDGAARLAARYAAAAAKRPRFGLDRDVALDLREEHYGKIRRLTWYRLREQCCRDCLRDGRFQSFLESDCGQQLCDDIRARLVAIGATGVMHATYDGIAVAIGPDGTVTPE